MHFLLIEVATTIHDIRIWVMMPGFVPAISKQRQLGIFFKKTKRPHS